MSDRPKWMPIYEHLRGLDYNADSTYDELSALAGVADIRTNRSPVDRAREELERKDRKTLVCIPNYGYRIADPTEHEYLGRAHRQRAARQLDREIGRRASTPFELLQPEDAERQKLEAINARRVADIFKRVADRPTLPRARPSLRLPKDV